MQTAIVTITPGAPDVRVARPLAITRSMANVLQLTLQTASGAAVDLSGVRAWEMGITQDFYATTPILAGTSVITAVANVLTVTLSGATLQLAQFLDGKRSAMGFATLKGFNGSGDLIHAYVMPVTLCNIGYNGDLLTDAVLELYWTAAQIEAKLADIAGTLEIPQDISDLTDTNGLLFSGDYSDLQNKPTIPTIVDASEAAKGIIQLASASEVTAGDDTSKAVVPATLKTELDKKVTVVSGKGLSTNDYTNTEKALVATIQNEALAALSGASVSIAPWTQSRWTATGACTLAATGWAASGHQLSYVLITLEAGATIAVSGATVTEDDAISGAGQYTVYLINQNGTVYLRIASYTEAV